MYYVRIYKENKFTVVHKRNQKLFEIVKSKERLYSGEIKSLAKEWKVNPITIMRYAQKFGVPTGNKYVETLPDKDKELGYICGLIAADGCLLGEGRKIIEINLVEEDSKTLSWVVKNLIKNSEEYTLIDIPSRTFGGYTNRSQKGFNLTLPKLYQYCLDMGITPRKSLTLDVKLEDKSDEFKLYFLRGVIDGDGCISIERSLGLSTIRVCSCSIKFISVLKEFFGGTISTNLKREENRHTYYVLQFKGNMARQLGEILPKDSFCLSRKTEKLYELLALEKVNRRASSILVGKYWKVDEKPKNIRQMWKESFTVEEITYVSFYQQYKTKKKSVEEIKQMIKNRIHPSYIVGK